MNRYRLRFVAVVAPALLGACAMASIAPSSSAMATKVAVAQKTKLPMKTIGIMGPVDAAETIKLGTDATDMAAKALGWKTIRVDPAGDPAKMASGMNSLVNSKVDAIVLTVIEPATIQAGLRAAAKAKIPVINTLALTHGSPFFAATYWAAPAAENKLLTDHMTKSLPQGSKVGMIQLPQFFNALIAQNLFIKSAKQHGWQVVARHDADLANLVPDVKKAVSDMIRANPDIDAIVGVGDFVPPGAVPAIRQSGKQVKVYSVHGVPSSMQFVKEGIAELEFSDAQKGGFIAIDQLARHFTTGATIAKTTPKKFAFKMQIMTKAEANRGFPYPTSKVLAQFKARWNKIYIKAG